MILSSRVILSVYHIILVCLILIAVFAVFSQILKFFIPVSVVGCTLFGILAGYWVINIISRNSLVLVLVIEVSVD